VAAFDDEQPTITLEWAEPRTIRQLELSFDTDWDHPMESVLMGHPERIMPFCVQQLTVYDAKRVQVPVLAGQGASSRAAETLGCKPSYTAVATLEDNHESRRTIRFAKPMVTDRLVLRLTAPSGQIPAALFELRCYDH